MPMPVNPLATAHGPVGGYSGAQVAPLPPRKATIKKIPRDPTTSARAKAAKRAVDDDARANPQFDFFGIG